MEGGEETVETVGATKPTMATGTKTWMGPMGTEGTEGTPEWHMAMGPIGPMGMAMVVIGVAIGAEIICIMVDEVGPFLSQTAGMNPS